MTIHVQRLRLLIPMVGIVLTIATSVSGQGRVGPPGSVHQLHSTLMPPGAIAREQLVRDSSFRGYFQPVELYGPEGSSISLVMDGRFLKSQPSPVRAGMLIGKVYRFRVTGIKRNEGFEVFPTVEVINRMYPPKGQATRFPIPIELTEDDLELAITGRFVTRVIYLEDPRTALPLPQNGKQQRYYEVAPDQDPVQVADGLGRPMAILRMGSRTPSANEPIASFAYGSPPLLVFPRLNEPEEVKPPRQARAPFPNRTNGAAAASTEGFSLVPSAPRPPSRASEFPPRGERRSR
jgi:hypothetical protein